MDWYLQLSGWIHLLAGVMWIGLLYYFNSSMSPAAKARRPTAPPPHQQARHARALFWFAGRGQ